MLLDAVASVRNAARRHPVDPTLEVVYTLAGAQARIDDDLGRPGTAGRMRTPVERDGKPLAALLHDPALARNPERLRAAVRAASLVIDNERLKAELNSRLRDVEASRTRLVEAADRERRRVERNLHDGAQQRLVGLALTLRLAGREAEQDPAVSDLLHEALSELDHALSELRSLARGLHPAILADAGLIGALETLAERPGLPVELSVDLDVALPDVVEIAAYYVVAEALANANKHAHATRVRVQVAMVGGSLHVAVTDDGAGGATLIAGSGLEGLADRVNALSGTLVVDSPPGQGTTVAADFPLASAGSVGRSPQSLAALRWMGWENWEVPAEMYDQIAEVDTLDFAKATLLCAGGNAALTEQERDWHLGYRAAAGDSEVVLEAVRTYDDSDRIEDIAALPAMRVTVRAMIFDALRMCGSDGPLTEEELARILDAAGRIGVSRDVVAQLRAVIADANALRRRRYELVSGPMFAGARAGSPGTG